MALATRLLACAALAVASSAHAQQPARATRLATAWSRTARPTYTNIKKETEGKKCTVVTREVSVVSGAPPQQRAAATPTPAGLPQGRPGHPEVARRRPPQDPRGRAGAEEKGLADAKAKLAEQESIRNGDEKNYQRVLDRLKPYQDAVERHERNVVRAEAGALRAAVSPGRRRPAAPSGWSGP